MARPPRLRRHLTSILLVAATLLGVMPARAALPKLAVSENRRFLVEESGKPFFWQADSAWEISTRLSLAEADRYLRRRQEQGFTVVILTAFSNMDGPRKPNTRGDLPFESLDPPMPAVKEGPENDYWDHLDSVLDRIQSLGMYVGLLPMWGACWHDPTIKGHPLFNIQSAEAYCEWLGRRYRDRALIWILGGDRMVETELHKEVMRAMARGLRRGDGGTHLITFHPYGGRSSAEWFHEEPWLDFNLVQSGHNSDYRGTYDKVARDYRRQPPKPIVEGESLYEGHPLSFNPEQFGHSLAADVRRPVYWALFQGSFGFTYSHHAAWQFWTTNREPITWPLLPWPEALDEPGALQMLHAKNLMLSRPVVTRVPDDSLIVTDRVPTWVPGGGRYRFVATRDEEATYAMVYVPVSAKFQVHLDKISGPRVKTWWFDPRTGRATHAGSFPNQAIREFTPPHLGELMDHVLVLDDARRGYPPPGRPPGRKPR